jgi:DNA-binding IclR family transcriptional regulator
VRQFIQDEIDSVAQLEALLLLRHNRTRPMTSEAVAEGIYLNVKETAPLLEGLVARGFVSVEGTQPKAYRYQPRSPEVAKSIDQLAEAYSRYLVPVTNLIHQKPRRVIQEFADAFKLKKEE